MSRIPNTAYGTIVKPATISQNRFFSSVEDSPALDSWQWLGMLSCSLSTVCVQGGGGEDGAGEPVH